MGEKKSYFAVGHQPVEILGSPIMLCATGFKPNPNDKYKCIKIEKPPEPELTDEEKHLNNLCYGFTKAKYQGNAVMELYQDGDCYKYKCIGEKIGFKSLEDKTCVICPERSGVKRTGECSVPCEPTWHWVKDKETCERDMALTKTDLLYGRNKISPNIPFENVCWPVRAPIKYARCVLEGGR